jgi:hypothetical protein
MAKRNLGVAMIASGGLVYLAALVMGIAGIPRPGWGYYKILLAVFGLAAAAAGVLLLERERAKGDGGQNRGNRFFVYGCVFNLVLSIFPRLPFFNDVSSWWRPSHTLLTAFWFQKEGIRLVDYQTPLYGPPFQVPLEFPLYQAVTAVFSSGAGINLTISAHIISLVLFYLSALFLLLLCLEFVDSKVLCFVILTVYLWLPYDIRYSTEILPDYFSVALALSYLYWLCKWLARPRNYLWFFLAVLSGCLGALVKITTMPIVMIPAVLMTLDGIRSWGIDLKELFSPRKFIGYVKKHAGSFFLLAVIAVLPLASILAWVRYTDAVKQANIYTEWLTTANESSWWAGTLSQKLSYAEWLGKFDNIRNFFLSGAMLVFPVAGVACLNKLSAKSRSVFGSALAGTLLAIFIFFNSYFHEYYYIAVSALISVVVGFGVYGLYRFVLQKRAWWHVFSGILLLFIIMAAAGQYAFIRRTADQEKNHQLDVLVPLAQKVAAVTPADGYVISFQWDWYADFLFFAQRKGLIISPREEPKFTCESVTPYRYTTVVVVDGPADAPGVSEVLKCFGTVEEVEPGLYTVGP